MRPIIEGLLRCAHISTHTRRFKRNRDILWVSSRERKRGREREGGSVRERGGRGAGVKQPQPGKMVLEWSFRVAKKLGLSQSLLCVCVCVVCLRDIVGIVRWSVAGTLDKWPGNMALWAMDDGWTKRKTQKANSHISCACVCFWLNERLVGCAWPRRKHFVQQIRVQYDALLCPRHMHPTRGHRKHL
jgi:hypothetical protein